MTTQSQGTKRGAKPGNKNAIGNNGGRPTKYKKEYAELAYNYCLLGAIDQELSAFFNVDEHTINNWKAQHIEFLQSLKDGKEVANAQVALSLFKRATGYNAPDVDIKVVRGKIVKTKLVKHYPPDPTSMIYWLNNRQKDKWRNNHHFEIDFDRLSDEQLDKIVNTLIDKSRTQ